MWTRDQIAEELRRRIPPPARQALVGSIRTAYRLVRSRYHVPEDGHNEITFGIQVHAFNKMRQREFVLAEGRRHGLTVVPRRHVFWLECNGVVLASYRLPGAGEDWEECFPLNNIGAGQLTEMNRRIQVELFREYETETGLPGALVLAHSGSSTEGCRGVFLMEPVAQKNGRISEWGHTEVLWKVGTDSEELPRPVKFGPVPLVPKDFEGTGETDVD